MIAESLLPSFAASANTNNSQQLQLETNVAAWELSKKLAAVDLSLCLDSLCANKKLDETIRSFSAVLHQDSNGKVEIDMALLLQACRQLMDLMRSGGGATLILAAKDLESNLQKVQSLYDKQSPVECQTLSSLLELERDSGIHKNGTALLDPSAAIGLLWIRRSLAHHCHMISLVVSCQKLHPREAGYEAYAKHLSPYHGMWLQSIFPAAISQSWNREQLLAKYGEIEVEAFDDQQEAIIVHKLRTLVATWEPLLSVWKEEFERLGMEDTRRVWYVYVYTVLESINQLWVGNTLLLLEYEN